MDTVAATSPLSQPSDWTANKTPREAEQILREWEAGNLDLGDSDIRSLRERSATPAPTAAQRTWLNSSRLRETLSVKWSGCWVHVSRADDLRAEVGDAEEFESCFGLPVTDERAYDEAGKMPKSLLDKIDDALDAYRRDED